MLFQKDHMEHIVDLGAGWQLQAIGHRTHPFQDLIRPVKAGR